MDDEQIHFFHPSIHPSSPFISSMLELWDVLTPCEHISMNPAVVGRVYDATLGPEKHEPKLPFP
jgi:hypothetical protein